MLHHGHLPAGRHILGWDGRDQGGQPCAAGVYLCRLTDAGVLQARRLSLVP